MKYFEGGHQMFSGWPEGQEPKDWHNRKKVAGVSHTTYDNLAALLSHVLGRTLTMVFS